MTKNIRIATFAALFVSLATTQMAQAQSSVLAEMYGRGVHAYCSRNYSEARQLLSMAIDNGIKDPRAYYFRGIVAYSMGSTFEAESDWQLGAELEAQGNANPLVGRSLVRFQGSGRLKLEGIRQQARLQAHSLRAARAAQGQAPMGQSIGTPPPPSEIPPTALSPAVPPPPPVGEDPFSDDLAEGEPSISADDALEGAMEDPFSGEPTAPATDSGAGDDPFGGDDASDPFGGDDAGAVGDDPFGEDAESADPFGEDGGSDDPFGGDGADDPFADDDDPFGS